MTQQLQTRTEPEPLPIVPSDFTAFGSINHFTDAQRMAKALYSSSIVPEGYRGETHMGDCLIALEIANRIGANVLAVMQNLYIVHGKPAWSSQFLIACVNASRRFSPLRYVMTGDKGTDSYGCVAWATDKMGERLESPEITIGIAKAEGWFQKNGSKWKTMPELMLRYRVATLFARLYAPELTMGIQSADEVEDIIDIAPVVTEPAAPKERKKLTFVKKGAEPETAQETATTTPEPAVTTPATPATPAEPAQVGSELAAVLAAITPHGITEAQLFAVAKSKGLVKDETSLGQLRGITLKNLARIISKGDEQGAKWIEEAKAAQ